LKRNAGNCLINRREPKKLNRITKERSGQKIGHPRRYFERIISLRRGHLEEGLIIFDISTRSLNHI
jgi:hypothetical protein